MTLCHDLEENPIKIILRSRTISMINNTVIKHLELIRGRKMKEFSALV